MSSINNIYATFLVDPTPAVLASDVALNYITTATQITEAEKVAEHLTSLQDGVIKKEEQKVLNVVEGYCSLSLEVKTTIEFVEGGGPYLPDVDAESVKGKTVTFIVIHIVHFDGSNKIAQIRLLWDQAALLKQLAIIPSDNTWPIKEPIEQTQLVTDSATAAAKVAPEKPVKRTVLVKKSSVTGSPSANRTTTSRPNQRTPSEIFGRHPDSSGSSTPKKERTFRTDPKKYSHFEFGEENHAPKWDFEDFNTPDKPKPKVLPAHVRHFGISEEDVDDTTSTTPQKPTHTIKPRKDAETHFEIRSDGTPGPLDRPRRTIGSFENKGRRLYDTNVVGEASEEDVPARAEKPKPHATGLSIHGRKDIDSHWDLDDIANSKDSNEKNGANTKKAPSHARHNKELGHRWDVQNPDDGEPDAESTARAPSHARHNKELGHRWDASDESNNSTPQATKPISSDRAKAVKNITSSYNLLNDDPSEIPDDEHSRKPSVSSSTHARAAKDFQSTWDLPSGDTPVKQAPRKQENRYSKSVQNMHSSWDDFYDQSTPARKQAEKVARKEENPVPSRQAGNPRYDQFQRHWGFGDDNEF